MLERDALVSELNAAQAAVADLRNAEETDTDALTSAIVRLSAVREELAAHDATRTPATITPAAPAARKTLGQEIAESDVLTRGVGASGRIENRDVFTSPTEVGGLDIVVPDYAAGIDARPVAPLSFLDLMPVVPTPSDTVVFFKQTGFTNAAAGVPRRSGGTYGAYQTSDIAIDKVTVSVAKIGHAIITDSDTLADREGIAALLSTEGVYGVREAMEQQLLASTDTTNGLTSVVVTGEGRAQTHTYSNGADGAEILDAIREAKTKAEVAQLPANVVVVSPQVRETIELAKDGSESYIGAGPFAGPNGTVWGMTLVTTYNLEDASNIVVGSTQALRLRSRRGIDVETSNSHEGLFLQDGIAIKVSGRFALENRRPEAWVVISEAPAEETEEDDWGPFGGPFRVLSNGKNHDYGGAVSGHHWHRSPRVLRHGAGRDGRHFGGGARSSPGERRTHRNTPLLHGRGAVSDRHPGHRLRA
jgi:HK97 family phage major capsid protein